MLIFGKICGNNLWWKMLRKKKFSKPRCNMHARWAASEGNVYQYQKVPESTTRYQKVSERYRKGIRKFQKGTSGVRGRNAGAMLTSHSVRRRCAWALSSVRRRSLFVKRVRTTRGLCRLSQSAASCCWSFQSTITSQKSTCILLCYVSRILYLSYIW